MSSGIRFDANLSMLFTDLPLLARPAAAADAGYRAVELWWPFDVPVPVEREIESLRRALADAGTQLVSLNLDGGDVSAGDRGLLSIPDKTPRVRANAEAALAVAEATGCGIVNALYGNRVDAFSPGLQDETALENLCWIAKAAEPARVTVVVETLNSHDSPRFPLTDLDTTHSVVTEVRRRTGRENVGLLFDVYHLHRMGEDLVGAVRRAGADIAHVQFADAPGRGRPGTGSIDFELVLTELNAAGYAGHVGLEYIPAPGQPDSLPPFLAVHHHPGGDQ